MFWFFEKVGFSGYFFPSAENKSKNPKPLPNPLSLLTHDRLHPGVQAVVDAVGPDRRQEEQHLVREKVHRNEEEPNSIRQGLRDAVERRKGQARKGAQRRLLVVLVVDVVEFPDFVFLVEGKSSIGEKEREEREKKGEVELISFSLSFFHPKNPLFSARKKNITPPYLYPVFQSWSPLCTQ